MNLKKFCHTIIGVLPFSIVRIFFFNLMGNKISYSAKVGWGVYMVNKLLVEKKAKISAFNFIYVNEVILSESSFIKHFNYFNGPFSVVLKKQSGISRQNKFTRSNAMSSYCNSSLTIDEFSFIVSNNFFDLTRSISIGKNSIIAGLNSQFWTHGFYHADTGKDRIRIDGEITIGNNVYVGSRCIFNPGVSVANAIHIGGGSVISKNLTQKGMYVNQPLRYIENNIEVVKSKLTKVEKENLEANIYIK